MLQQLTIKLNYVKPQLRNLQTGTKLKPPATETERHPIVCEVPDLKLEKNLLPYQSIVHCSYHGSENLSDTIQSDNWVISQTNWPRFGFGRKIT
jgi:hypothetical protein